jgi:hypothetical protein
LAFAADFDRDLGLDSSPRVRALLPTTTAKIASQHGNDGETWKVDRLATAMRDEAIIDLPRCLRPIRPANLF